MPYKANDSRRHKFPKARYRIENWRTYDAALRDRGDLTVWVTPQALVAWHPVRTGRRGRSPTYSNMAIETGMMLRLAFGRPWRQTEGLLRSVAQLMNLGIGIPDHTTLSRRSAAASLVAGLAKVTGPVHVVIDSTGLEVYGAGEWHHAKHGGRDRRTWRKLHLAVADRAPMAEVIIPPRSPAQPGAQADQAPTQRDRHLQMIKQRGRLGWQRATGYGRRSLVETAMFRYKTLIGRRLRARSLPGQKAEARTGCAVINRMTHLGMPVSARVA